MPIRLLAWEPPYAMGAALEKAKRHIKKKKKRKLKLSTEKAGKKNDGTGQRERRKRDRGPADEKKTEKKKSHIGRKLQLCKFQKVM